MSVAELLTQPNPTGSLSRFVLDVINGVIEGDAWAARERIRLYRSYLSAIEVPADAPPNEIAQALQQAVDAGVLPAPLRNSGTVVTGRFSAQTEWRVDAEGGLSVGVGAVSLTLGLGAGYARQQAEASEFTITLAPTDVDAFSALAALHGDAQRRRALPEPGAQPDQ